MIHEIKPLLLILTLLVTSSVVAGQTISSEVKIVKIYSQNERFYLRSVPYDDESPSLRGVTSVYEKGKRKPVYTLDRAFDLLALHDTLILSNDGEVIFYVITYDPDEEKDGLKSVNVYKRGKLIRSFTETEITGCDKTKERCSLVYANDVEGKSSPLYTLDRSFDPALNERNTLFLSNDGELIFYIITWGAKEETDGMRSVNVYKRGKLIRSFTESEITGCDEKKERC